MKKTIRLLLLILLLFALCSCENRKSANIALFAERYNSLGEEKLSYSALSATEREGKTECSFVASADESGEKKVLVTLLADENKRIFECRLVIAKTDGQRKIIITDEDVERFVNSCERVFCGFSGVEYEKAKDVVSLLKIHENFFSSGENTAQSGEYYAVFLSNEVCCDVIFRNSYLKKTEETEKPESRAVYDNTTNIRTDTVPHK